MMSQIDSWHWKFFTGRHFKNGRHNTTQIQHFPISTPFHMWVDYDVPYWFLTSKNFYRSPFSKWPPQYRTNSTLSDFNDIYMLVNYDVPNWFLTLKNFYRSPFSKWPPQYRTNSTLFDFNVLNWYPTSKNFYRSPFSKWLPQYRKNSTFFDFKGSFWFIF
jgi:hypothetical protein